MKSETTKANQALDFLEREGDRIAQETSDYYAKEFNESADRIMAILIQQIKAADERAELRVNERFSAVKNVAYETYRN